MPLNILRRYHIPSNSFVFQCHSEAMECTSERLIIRDKEGRLLFSATRDEVLVGARHLTVKGEGGAVFSGSVQTAHVTAPVRENLLLESLTRSLEITAPQGVALESRAGTITARCLHDFTLQSTGGVIKFDTPNIFVRGLRTSTIQSSDPSRARPDVYQVCVCSSGRLFLAVPSGVCAADQDFCK
ncbi:zeta-sarcoglycan-like [Cherax quadricarinatus]|uniref:zeta-sarcoglycan-like n=1 Tax=Cherax quadricarinatus TaxID=27406 RepID=UPI00387E34D2